MKGWQEIRTPFHWGKPGRKWRTTLKDKLSFHPYVLLASFWQEIPKAHDLTSSSLDFGIYRTCRLIFFNARESWNRKIFRFRWVYFVQSYYFQRKIAREVIIFTIDILSFLHMWDTMNGLLQVWWNKGAAILRTPSFLKYSKTFSLSLIPAFLILQLSHTTLGRTIQTIINCHNERSSAWLWLNIHAKEVKLCRQDKFGRRFKIGQISRYPCPQNWRKSPEHTGEKAKARGNKRSLALRAKSRKTLLT